ncbi:major capsid protein [Nocardia otitidiscaviarum]|uniref:major capsid protein n=1 Tax=Nocardia otitidiscaviarum TaxID=1823 RepID=UPI001893D7C6|nr:major capsid protein [Nocardia otitidiscaviarum]MBF6138136.1 major capsid protein [Nocardia otitidiscaviarum]
MFRLPKKLPGSREELTTLLAEAQAAFDEIVDAINADNDKGPTDEQLENLRYLKDAFDQLDTAVAEIDAADQGRREEADRLLSEVRARTAPATDDTDADSEDGSEDDGDENADAIDEDTGGGDGDEGGEAAVVAEAERATREAADPKPVTAAAKRTSFAGAGRGRTPKIPASTPAEPTAGWQMRPDAPGYQPGLQPLSTITAGLKAAARGTGSAMARPNGNTKPSGHVPQYLGSYVRDVPAVEDHESLTAAIDAAVAASIHPDGSLTAACCPPPQVTYDFCPVEPARDLFVLPEVMAERCAISWPAEFDINLNFQVLCEAELNQEPEYQKECHVVPCPEDFNELRLCYLPLCIESDIIGDQAWPERTETFTQKLLAAQARQRSMWMLNKILTDPTTRSLVIPADSQIAAASSILNSLNIAAIGVRVARNLARDAVVAGAAPTWVFEVIRNDLANQEGIATFEVSDAQVIGWLNSIRVQLQFVGEWQKWDPARVEFPATVDIALWEQGAYFALVKPVIDLGVMYPRELLRINRYTRMFTEDGLNVGKKCGDSVVVTIPICPNGAIGNRLDVVCATGS